MSDNPHKVTNVEDITVKPISLRCPHCGRIGSFVHLKGSDFGWQHVTEAGPSKRVATNIVATIRRCPADECRGLVFIVLKDGKIFVTYPPETIDFDSTNLPPTIKSSLEEAIKAFAAGCFRASALMIRRTLEEVCKDKGATGNDLKGRLSKLGSQTTIPQELLDAADEIRLLGNDAAHVEAHVYDQIDKPHIEAAIELAKEILKGVYQYSALLQKLKDLKKPRP